MSDAGISMRGWAAAGLLAAALAGPAFPRDMGLVEAGKSALLSGYNGMHLVAWGEGPGADVQASARYADERAQLEFVAAGEGRIAIRSAGIGRYWSLDGAGPAPRVRCASDLVSEAALFLPIRNQDGTLSLRSAENGRYLTVVEEDSLVDPGPSAADSASLAQAGRMSRGAPFVATRSLLRAGALDIGPREKFRILPAAQPKRAAGRAGKVVTYLNGIRGQQTVAGIHNREPNSDPARWTNWVNGQTGKYPGLWSGDFLYSGGDISNRGTMIRQAAEQWRQGAVVTLMYHMCPPSQGESCGWEGGVKSRLSDDQWSTLVTDGGTLNKVLKQRLGNIAGHIRSLKDQGVEVLFRPFHEMNQAAFWWGGRKGPDGTARLYRITRDYLVDSLGLTNLYFVWSVQDLDWSFQDYNPGDAYWDVMSLDFYNGDGFTSGKYNAMLDIAGTRPIAIGETDRVPSSAVLKTQPAWAYFCGWSELTQRSNSAEQIKDSYAGELTVSRDEMPGWNNILVVSTGRVGRTARDFSPMRWRLTSRYLGLELSGAEPVRFSLHDAAGGEVASGAGAPGPGLRMVTMPGRGLGPGVYLLRWDAGRSRGSERIRVMHP